MALDFHVFAIQDFDVLIGHPLEKLFVDPPKIGELDVKLGETLSPYLSLESKTQWQNLSPILTCPRRSCRSYPLIPLSCP
jgi:hypothetical protein